MTPPKTMILIKYYFITVILLLSFSTIFSQSNKNNIARNTIYAEVASEAAVYSVNYDHIFHLGDKVNWSYRIGFSIEKKSIAVPLGINIITGQKDHHAEFGLTLEPYIDKYKTFLNGTNESDKYLYIIPAAGYRYQPAKGGFFFKASASPTIFLDPPSDNFWKMDPKLIFYGSVGAGVSF